MFCSKCGTANVEANLFCASCGNSLKPTASVSPVTPRSRQTTPILLSILALVCLGVWLVASPYITLWRLNTALTNSDVETLNALVNWESVRAEVKSGLATAIGVTTQPSDLSTSSSPGFPIWSWYPPPENRRRALIFLGSDARNPAAEGDTQWVNYKPSHFSSRSMGI